MQTRRGERGGTSRYERGKRPPARPSSAARPTSAARPSPVACLLLAAALATVLVAAGCRDRDDKKAAGKAPARAAATRVAPPAGTVVFQPMFVWSDGTTTLQGTGFFASAPGGRVVAVTSTHFFNRDGPRLLEARWMNVRTGDTAATFGASWAPPGDGGRTEPQPDLRSDYLLLPAAKAPDRAAVLEFDPRPKPDVGERVRLPNKDPSAEAGHTWVEGVVAESDEKYVTVRLDGKIQLQSQSGSPVLSQATGKVIGTLSRARQERDRTVLSLAPAGAASVALAKPPANLPLRDVVGRSAAAQQARGATPATGAAPGDGVFERKEIVRLTEAAARAVFDAARSQQVDLTKTGYLRAGMKPQPGGGLGYLLDVTQEVDPRNDLLSESQGIRIVVDRKDATYLSGTTIDYKSGATSGFVFNNPNSKAEPAE